MVETYVCSLHAATVSVSLYVHMPCCIWKSLSNIIYHLWLMQSLPFLQHRSLNLEEKTVNTTHLGAEGYKGPR